MCHEELFPRPHPIEPADPLALGLRFASSARESFPSRTSRCSLLRSRARAPSRPANDEGSRGPRKPERLVPGHVSTTHHLALAVRASHHTIDLFVHRQLALDVLLAAMRRLRAQRVYVVVQPDADLSSFTVGLESAIANPAPNRVL